MNQPKNLLKSIDDDASTARLTGLRLEGKKILTQLLEKRQGGTISMHDHYLIISLFTLVTSSFRDLCSR
jgi:hypothetical protein